MDISAPSHIRVLDAPPIGVTPRRNAMASPGDAEPVLARGLRAVAFGGLLTWALFYFSSFSYVPDGPINAALVYGRYLLWPAIMIAVGMHLARHGSGGVARAVAPFLPFFAIGLISGTIGYSPFNSARQLIFWSLAVLSAAAIGSEFAPRRLERILFWLFAIAIAGSIAVALVLPDVGTLIDDRTGAGVAWQGLFVGKNAFGPICVYTMLLAILVRGVPIWLRAIVFIASVGALIMSLAQGSIIAGATIILFLIALAVIRRLDAPVGVKSALMAIGIMAGVAVMAYGFQPLLVALGRDATLTGRTLFWPEWLARAMDHWLIGAGPGSFTNISMTTIDITLKFLNWGKITSPHNMTIAIFGEVGLVGLIAFYIPLFYMMIVLPFRDASRSGLVTGTMAFVILMLGLAETREVFGIGINLFLLILFYASGRVASPRAEPIDEPASQTPRLASLGS